MSNTLKDKTIIVTGGNGFIGGHLIARLVAERAHVVAVVRPGRTVPRLTAMGEKHVVIEADVGDANSVKSLGRRYQPHYVYHLVAERDKERLVNNLSWSSGVAASLMRAFVSPNLMRFVTIGSSLEVPAAPGIHLSPHGIAKAKAMETMQKISEHEGIPFSAFRTHYVYGPLQSERKFIPTVVRAILENKPIRLTDRHIAKRYIYVSDIIEACLRILDLPPRHDNVYMATAPNQHTNHEIVEAIAHCLERDVQISETPFRPRQWDREHWGAENGLPNWAPMVDLEIGLQNTIAAEIARVGG